MSSIDTSYDVIFSTFVREHVTNPKELLQHGLQLLKPDGRLILASPRYDFPFYIPRSARHYSRAQQVHLGLWLLLQRGLSRWSRNSRFLIHLDPAVLSKPWYQDSDAVHWPSLRDVRYATPPGYALRRLSPVGPRSLRFEFFCRFLLLFVEFRRIS